MVNGSTYRSPGVDHEELRWRTRSNSCAWTLAEMASGVPWSSKVSKVHTWPLGMNNISAMATVIVLQFSKHAPARNIIHIICAPGFPLLLQPVQHDWPLAVDGLDPSWQILKLPVYSKLCQLKNAVFKVETSKHEVLVYSNFILNISMSFMFLCQLPNTYWCWVRRGMIQIKSIRASIIIPFPHSLLSTSKNMSVT